MKFEEQPFVFPCAGEELVGVLTEPETPKPIGLLVIVGGPQYRVGSHRQFVLLARYLGRQGYSVLRFDHRGMGDSGGAERTFESIGDDIRSAVDAFSARAPGLRSIVLWGLCDGASAAMMYAAHDERVGGLVLLNPWARGEETFAKTQLRHYYLSRVLSGAFWKKLARGELRLFESARSLTETLTAASRADGAQTDYRERMRAGVEAFGGRVLFVFSGRDLTAREFLEYAGVSSDWRRLLSSAQVTRIDVPNADHTFSCAGARGQVGRATVQFLERLEREVQGKECSSRSLFLTA